MNASDEQRDLARIDAALKAGRATSTDPRERELEDLALALQATAPEPDPSFARDLDRRVAEGFKRPRKRRLALPRFGGGWMPALAAAAAALIVALVTVGILSSGGEDNPASESLGARQNAPSPTVATPSAGAGNVAGSEIRHVERSAQMTLAASAGDLQGVAQSVGRVAEAHGGYVLRSNVGTGEESPGGGVFVLRIPSKQLEAALSELGKLGDVRSRSESSQDMTGPYRGTQKQLADALLERRATIEKLKSATGPEKEALRTRLRVLSAEIDDLSGKMDQLRRKTVFSTVTVTLEEKKDAGGAGVGGGGPGQALHDALATLSGALVLAIRVAGVLLPIALLALLAWLAARALRRRRREAVLF